MPPIVETATAVAKAGLTVAKEAAKEVVKDTAKEATKKVLRETSHKLTDASKEVAKKNMETSQKISEYAKQYRSGDSKSIAQKLETARKNPETRRALFNALESDSKLKGTLNEQERIADFKNHCSNLRTEVYSTDGKNRIDILGETKTPIRFTELCCNDRQGLYTKNILLPKGEAFAYECKDGSLNYLKTDLPHIAQQVKAGRELSGGQSFLQITPKVFNELKAIPLAEQKSFVDTFQKQGGRLVVDGTSSQIRTKSIREALKN